MSLLEKDLNFFYVIDQKIQSCFDEDGSKISITVAFGSCGPGTANTVQQKWQVGSGK